MEQNAQFLGDSNGHYIFVLNDHNEASHPSLPTKEWPV